MNLETFFEKFELFADAPNTVAKMRELVLELAVQGKLTDREAGDGCVNVCYADEPSSELLPTNWHLLNFGRFCDIQGGTQPPKNQFSHEPKPGYVRLFQIRDLGESPVPTYIREETTTRFCRKGEILIGRYGASVGKIFWAQDGTYKVALAKFIYPQDAFLPKFAFLALKSDFFQAKISGASRSAQAGFNKGDLAAIDLPLPPLAEQKRIVAKVDALMALCDRLEAQQRERETQQAALARAAVTRFADAPTSANIELLFHKSYSVSPVDLRKTVLTLAMQGKLVSQDPNDEPASATLTLIEARRDQLISAKQFRRSQLSLSQAAGSFSIPDSWEWTHLGNAMLNVTDGFHSTPKPTEAGVPYVTAKHVKPESIDFENCLYVSEEDFKEISSKTRPTRGDVLVVNIGAGCGLPAIIEVDFEFAFKNVAILNRPNEVDPKYLFNYLLFLREDIFEDRTKGGAQPFLSLGMIREIPFPLPPLAEQRRIVAKVDQLMALVDKLERQLNASRAAAATLMEALVAELTEARTRIKADNAAFVEKKKSEVRARDLPLVSSVSITTNE